MAFIWTTGGSGRTIIDAQIGNCQFCHASDCVDLIEQRSETKLFGLFQMKPQIHRIAKCRKCGRVVKEEYYQGRTKPIAQAAAIVEGDTAAVAK